MYINAEHLPPLLNDNERLDLLRRVRFGDQNARTKFIDSHLRLVVKSAKKFNFFGFRQEDLVDVGTIGLLKATDHLKNNLEDNLIEFLSKVIEKEILTYIEQREKMN